MTDYQVIIVGTGFGGQAAAIELLNQQQQDFLLLERRSFMGGTWVQNSYPGAAVDVQSPLYSLSAVPYDWTQMYASRDELKGYTDHVIERFGLAQKTRLNSTVTAMRWDAQQRHWQVQINGSEYLTARYVINASGPLSTPVIPNFAGRDSFQGVSFHTNNWDHSVSLAGKRVAIIGSGASAAQVIPAIVDEVAELHVFQRSPHWVVKRHDYVFKPWQRRILRTKWGYKLLRGVIYLALELRVLGFKYSKRLLQVLAGNEARQLIHEQIKDPELQAKVTPDFTIGCKRVIISNTLYPAYCREHVQLHGRDDGIASINATGLVTQTGQQLDVDVIVYSTGYDATDGMICYPVTGEDGHQLADFWHDYPRAYLGTSVPKFPNLFIVTGPNTGIGHTSALVVIEAQLQYIVRAMAAVQRLGKQAIAVKADAEQRYTDHIHQQMEKTVWHWGGCNSWYKSKSGKVIAMFPGFSLTFKRWTRNFKAADHHFID
ncbi:MAG: Baeyer-Villiger monooxygenase [Pseudidiomarina mangrovi]|nr:MAG: Baeyer-Villiger monooxygenase [Pseudidiomarina mangrovi]